MGMFDDYEPIYEGSDEHKRRATTPAPAQTSPAPKGMFDDYEPINEGAKPTPPAAIAAPAPNAANSIIETGLHKVDDAMRGMADGATLGITSKVEQYFDPEGHKARSEAAAERSPYLTAGSKIVGSIAPGIGAAKALGKLVPRLFGQPTIGSAMRSGAVSAPAMSAGEDLVQGETPDPVKAGIALGVGGIGGAVGQAVSQFGLVTPYLRSLMPGATNADRAAMRQVGKEAAEAGVPLRVDEIAKAAVPEKATGLEAALNTTLQVPRGSHAIATGNAQRSGAISDTVRGLADDLGPGLPNHQGRQIGQKVINNATDEIDSLAAPGFAASRNSMVPPSFMNNTPVLMDQASGRVMGNDAIEYAAGRMAPDSIGHWDLVLKDMRAKATQLFEKGRSLEAKGFEKAADDIENVLANSSASYGQSRATVAAGRASTIDPLKGSPIGKMAEGQDVASTTQGLLSASSPAEAGIAREAIRRTNAAQPSAGRDMMSTRLGQIADNNPSGVYDELITSRFSGDLAEDMVGPQKWERINRVLRSAKNVSNKGDDPSGTNFGGGVISQGIRSVLGFKEGRVARGLMDPNNTDLLGVIGPTQLGIMGLSGPMGAAVGERLSPNSRRRN